MSVATISCPVHAVSIADERPVIEVIVRAFSADPCARWVWPDAEQYQAAFPAFVRAFGGKAFACGTAFATEEFRGAALWLPPGVAPEEEELSAVLERTIAERDRDAASAFFEQTWRDAIARGTYLEATNQDNRRLYERYGFETLGTIQIGDSPPLFPMWREPR